MALSLRLAFLLIIGLFCLIPSSIAKSHRNSTTARRELEKRVNHGGRATWFNPGEGNCGGYNKDSDSIVAMSYDIYGKGTNCDQVRLRLVLLPRIGC